MTKELECSSMKGKNYSCNNVEKKRRKSDFYETPYSMTRQLLEVEDFDYSKEVLEPAFGNGAISSILETVFDKVKKQDINTGQDFLNYQGKTDYIITNPPFSLAKEFILKAKESCHKFAMLLPLSYLHGKDRYDSIYQDTVFSLKNLHIFTRYPLLGEQLRDDGKYRTGMMVYAWYVWEKSYKGKPKINWIDNNNYVLKRKKLNEQLPTDYLT